LYCCRMEGSIDICQVHLIHKDIQFWSFIVDFLVWMTYLLVMEVYQSLPPLLCWSLCF
jgi:hypothetical protein